jgi:hypothetical protein
MNETPDRPPDLKDLAEILEQEKPRPEPGFADRLDQRAGAGFPPSRGHRALRRPSTRKLLPALAAAASVLIAVAVITSVGGSGDDKSARVESAKSGEGNATPAPALDDRARNGGAAGVAPPAAPAAGRRRVERSANLTLGTDSDDVENVADDVVQVTDRYHGIVISSNVTSGESQPARATFDLRIPVDHWSAALSDLSGLAHVESRSQSAQDVTAGFNSAEDRLKDARAERRALLKRLAKAANPTQAAAIRQQLAAVRSQIAAAKGDLHAIRARTDYVTLAVAVEGGKSGAGGGAWTPGDALRDGLRILQSIAAILLVCLAVGLPFALLGGAAGLAGQRLRQRQRDRILQA